MIYEYGAMSSKFSCEAENKLTAYATMVFHYDSSAHLIVIYSPESSKKDSWTFFDGKISERLHEIFGGKPEEFPEKDAFDLYVQNHIDEIKACYKSIKRLI